MKIVLKGYYGFGNLGDDILLSIAFEWFRINYPSSDVVICTDASAPDYIQQLLGHPVRVVKSNVPIMADHIVHGGGGQYFDFRNNGNSFRFLNFFIQLIGFKNYRRLYFLTMRLRKRTRVRGKFRSAVGLGVGSYTASSSRLYADILEMSEFTFARVRDYESFKFLKKYAPACDISVGTDMAFMLPQNPRQPPQKNIIGFVLRDWTYDNNQVLTEVEKVLRTLIEKKYDIRLFSFDAATDREYIQRFERDYKIWIWNPSVIRLPIFLQELAKCSIVISSRAHGVIMAASLTIPTIILQVEPKLRHIHSMIPNGTLLSSRSPNSHSIMLMIEQMILQHAQYSQGLSKDWEKNHDCAEKMFEQLKGFLNNAE